MWQTLDPTCWFPAERRRQHLPPGERGQRCRAPPASCCSQKGAANAPWRPPSPPRSRPSSVPTNATRSNPRCRGLAVVARSLMRGKHWIQHVGSLQNDDVNICLPESVGSAAKPLLPPVATKKESQTRHGGPLLLLALGLVSCTTPAVGMGAGSPSATNPAASGLYTPSSPLRLTLASKRVCDVGD